MFQQNTPCVCIYWMNSVRTRMVCLLHPPHSRIAPISLLWTSTLFYTCSYILLPLFSILHRTSEMRLNYFWTCDHQVSGLKALKNYRNVRRKSYIWVVITTCTKSTAFVFILLTLLRTFLEESFHYNLISLMKISYRIL